MEEKTRLYHIYISRRSEEVTKRYRRIVKGPRWSASKATKTSYWDYYLSRDDDLAKLPFELLPLLGKGNYRSSYLAK